MLLALYFLMWEEATPFDAECQPQFRVGRLSTGS